MPLKTRIYPEPGTRAADVLDYIKSNPETTKNSIITALSMNPSVVKKCIAALITNGRIVDNMDERGHHHYRVKKAL